MIERTQQSIFTHAIFMLVFIHSSLMQYIHIPRHPSFHINIINSTNQRPLKQSEHTYHTILSTVFQETQTKITQSLGVSSFASKKYKITTKNGQESKIAV
jgi:hypothetical protein